MSFRTPLLLFTTGTNQHVESPEDYSKHNYKLFLNKSVPVNHALTHEKMKLIGNTLNQNSSLVNFPLFHSNNYFVTGEELLCCSEINSKQQILRSNVCLSVDEPCTFSLKVLLYDLNCNLIKEVTSEEIVKQNNKDERFCLFSPKFPRPSDSFLIKFRLVSSITKINVLSVSLFGNQEGSVYQNDKTSHFIQTDVKYRPYNCVTIGDNDLWQINRDQTLQYPFVSDLEDDEEILESFANGYCENIILSQFRQKNHIYPEV